MGKLIIYTGPMKSGKTTKLIEQYNKIILKEPNTHMFKSKIDDRFSSVKVVARNIDEQILATLLNNIDMLWYFKDLYKNFFIDEFQFLDGDINIIRKLLDSGKNIWVSGLNLTSEKKPFGKMGELMCFADKIYFLTGKCDICGNSKGKFTNYNGRKDNDIVVGEEMYKCICNKCYKKLNNI